MDKRHPTRNALGMLRKAIQEDWPEPVNGAIESSSQESPVMAFTRYFYAGRANNALHPVALPSSTDLAAGAPLLQALLAIWPDTAQVEAWGWQFARYAAERQRPNQPPMSLSLAERLFGDVFVEGVRLDRERQLRQTATAQREAEKARFVHAAPKYAAPFSPTWSTACCQEPLRARSASALAKPAGTGAAAPRRSGRRFERTQR